MSMGLYGSYTIYAVERVDLYNPDLSYWEVFDLYHGQMNDLFNERLEEMVVLLDSDDYFRNPEKKARLTIPPEIDRVNDSLATIVAKCQANEEAVNVSSYCVSMEALQYYQDYLKRLELMKGELTAEPDSNVDSLLLEVADKNSAAELEADRAKDVLTATMSAYEEFANAYPMHQKYREVMTSLLKYKLALKDVRKEVQFFPTKFVDATSSYCQ